MRKVSMVVALLLAPAAAGAADERRGPVFDRRTGLYEPPTTDLTRAAARGDRAELARAAARLGPHRLARALSGQDQRLAEAALEGITLIPGGVRLVEQVTRALETPAIALSAARTLGRLLDGDDPRQLGDWEVPNDLVVRACQRLSRLAADGSASIGTRGAALEALAEAAHTCERSPAVVKLLADPSAEIRRAAALIVDEGEVLKRATEDADADVAAAAGAGLCRGRQRATKKVNGAPPATLRKLATAEPTAPEDVAEMLPCLAASPDGDDRKAAERARRAHAVLSDR